MILHGIILYYIVLHGVTRYYIVLHGVTWYCMVLHITLYYSVTLQTVADHAFSYIVYCNCMVYHGLPVSKHHGSLPWHTMVYLHNR